MTFDKNNFLESLNSMHGIKNSAQIRKVVQSIKDGLNSNNISSGKNQRKSDEQQYITTELDQIIKSRTAQRMNYYLKRLIKTLNEERLGKVNDINLNRWKHYDDIITDSLWIIDKRDNSGAHNAGYWGNFIPQIPNQLLRRYTRKKEWVLDTFLGSGTTLIECNRLGRNGVGIELQPKIVKLALKNINPEKNNLIRTEIIRGDSSKINYKNIFQNLGIKKIHFAILHPPYWDIIKFSSKKNDLSNSVSINHFLENFGKVVDRVQEVLDKERYMAVVIGDKYSNGEWVPLSFYTMHEVLKRKFTLKSIIIKNFEDTKGKQSQKELWRYRALAGGFYIFKHEYIFIFKKKN